MKKEYSFCDLLKISFNSITLLLLLKMNYNWVFDNGRGNLNAQKLNIQYQTIPIN